MVLIWFLPICFLSLGPRGCLLGLRCWLGHSWLLWLHLLLCLFCSCLAIHIPQVWACLLVLWFLWWWLCGCYVFWQPFLDCPFFSVIPFPFAYIIFSYLSFFLGWFFVRVFLLTCLNLTFLGVLIHVFVFFEYALDFRLGVCFYASAFRHRRHYVFGLSVRPPKAWNNLFSPVHGSIGPSDQPWPFCGMHMSVRPSGEVSGHLPENAWREWSEILHVDVSWAPSELVILWSWSVDFPPFGITLT